MLHVTSLSLKCPFHHQKDNNQNEAAETQRYLIYFSYAFLISVGQRSFGGFGYKPPKQ